MRGLWIFDQARPTGGRDTSERHVAAAAYGDTACRSAPAGQLSVLSVLIRTHPYYCFAPRGTLHSASRPTGGRDTSERHGAAAAYGDTARRRPHTGRAYQSGCPISLIRPISPITAHQITYPVVRQLRGLWIFDQARPSGGRDTSERHVAAACRRAERRAGEKSVLRRIFLCSGELFKYLVACCRGESIFR